MPHQFACARIAQLGINAARSPVTPGRAGLPPAPAADPRRVRSVLRADGGRRMAVVLGWLPVPTDSSPRRPTARSVEPAIEQVSSPGWPRARPAAFERNSTPSARASTGADTRSASASTLPDRPLRNTLVYKGCTPPHPPLGGRPDARAFPRITDPLRGIGGSPGAPAVLPNTFPSCARAPYRIISCATREIYPPVQYHWMRPGSVRPRALLATISRSIVPIVVEGRERLGRSSNVLDSGMPAGPLPLAVP